MTHFPICQIVGYKNSGKTTLMQHLIRYFADQKLQVGSLKHHGHGGEMEHITETDSYKHLQAGSAISAVQGERQFQLTVHDTAAYSLKELIQFYSIIPIDVLLIEGYKQANYPKIVLINSERDLSLLKEIPNIVAVGSFNYFLIKAAPYFTFSLTEIESYLPKLASSIISL